jgi:hypothetical protein
MKVFAIRHIEYQTWYNGGRSGGSRKEPRIYFARSIAENILAHTNNYVDPQEHEIVEMNLEEVT